MGCALACASWFPSQAQHVETFDINTQPDLAGYSIENAVELGGSVYFKSFINSQARLYQWDGTTMTRPGNLTNVESIAAYNGALYVATSTALSRIDGADTTLIQAFENTDEFVAFNSKLYFFAKSTADGWALFSYDGTSVVAEVDLTAGAGSTGESPQLADIGDKLVAGNNILGWKRAATYGLEFVSYDGTTVTEFDLFPGVDQWGYPNSSYPNGITGTPDGIFFTASASDQDPEVYLCTGTTATAVTNISASNTYDCDIRKYALLGGVPHFIMHHEAYGAELWKYENGAFTIVVDYVAGTGGLSSWHKTPMIEHNGSLYFDAQPDNGGREVYKYDGTNISAVTDVSASGTNIYWVGLGVHGDYIYCDTGESGDVSPFSHQISTGTTVAYGQHAPMNKVVYTEVTGGLFAARSTGAGWEPHIINGTTFTQIGNLLDQSLDANPRAFIAAGSKVYFNSYIPGFNDEQKLMVYENNAITQAYDFSPTDYFSFGDHAYFNNQLYFALSSADLTDIHGRELFRFDANGVPELVADINPGSGDSYPGALVIQDGALYFTTYVSGTGNALWEYDGTTLTQKTWNTSHNDPVSGPDGFYYVGYNNDYKQDIWRYDPATDTHTNITNFGQFAVSISDPTWVGTDLFFRVEEDYSNRFERLYRWDGTSVTEVTGFAAVDNGLNSLTAHADKLYFIHNNSGAATFYEYDPATSGLQSIYADAGTNFNSWQHDLILTSSSAGLLATIYTANEGVEYHVYDPALNSFSLLVDLRPGTDSPSWSQQLAVPELGKVFVQVEHSATSGIELAVIEFCEAPTNLRASNIQDVSTTLLWDIQPNTELYRIQYKETTASNWTTITKNSNVGQKTISGLTASTNYRWRVASKCHGSFTAYTPVESFKTLAAPCISPSNLLTNPITTVQARFNWGVETSAVRYKVRWREVGGAWTTFLKDAIHNKHWLTGLTPGTSYEWQIKSICAGDPGGAAWSAILGFSTPTMKYAGGFDELLTNDNASIDVNVVPNPNNGQFSLNVGSFAGQQATLHIFNPIGKLVYQQRFVGSEGYSDAVDLTSYVSGLYIVRITGNNINHTSKIVVR